MIKAIRSIMSCCENIFRPFVARGKGMQVNFCSSINNDRGASLLVALMMTALVAIIGATALLMTESEYRIVSNDRLGIRAFYNAESAGKEAASLLDTLAAEAPDDLRDFDPAWLTNADVERINLANWVVDDADSSQINAANAAAIADGNANMSVIFRGPAAGSSLDLGTPTMYTYDVYGSYVGPSPRDGSKSVIEMGYQVKY